MIIFEKNGQTQQVEEREAKRIEILERSGWQRSDVEPVEPPATGADGYDTAKTDADLVRIAETARAASRRRVEQKPHNVEFVTPSVDDAQRDITGMQDTPTGALPDDFPGLDALRDAGVGTYEQLRQADLTKVAGINKATVKRIYDRS